MDSDSNSLELILPKEEWDKDSQISPTIDLNSITKVQWTSANTKKLIELYRENSILWDVNGPFYKDRVRRQVKIEEIAHCFGTSAEEIGRKLHNLRTQFNNEVRKIKRRQDSGRGEEVRGSGWEYYDALLFLLPNSTINYTSTAVAERPNPSELPTVRITKTRLGADRERSLSKEDETRSTPDTAAGFQQDDSIPRIRISEPAPLSNSPMWSEDLIQRLPRNPDEYQIFGDFVASELRTLRSDKSRKKLKRMIQKAILQVEEEDDSS